jgi:hypothetical protein
MKIMKKNFIYGLSVAMVCFVGSSCSKFLDVEPEEVLVKEQMYRNVYDADAAVIGVYGKLLSLAEQHVLWNELRADLLTVTNRANPYLQEINTNDVDAISADNPYVNPRKFYEVILNCNDVLANFQMMRAENKFTPEEYNQRYSDIMAVRSWVYLQLGIHFGRIPYITDPLEDTDAVLDRDKYPLLEFEQLLTKLIADMEAIPYKQLYSSTESLMYAVDGYVMERFFINKQALLGDLHLWNNDYQKAAEYYKLVMTTYDNLGNDGFRYDRYKIKWAEVQSNDDIAVGYLRYREQDVRTLINSKTQGWRSMFSRTQDVLWNTEWVWSLPFSSNFSPQNPFISLFAANGGDHLLKPSLESFDLWNSQTQRNGVPYDARRDLSVSMSGQEGVVTKYTDEFSDIETMLPIDKFQRDGKWHLYRAAKLHLRFAEAANRDGHHKLAVGLLNNGVGRIYDDPNQTDKTDIQQTHLPFPYDFDARNGNNPHYRATWHRNDGLRGRAYVTFRELNPTDSLTQIENYLIEEAALEMAFEGSRWEDLLRVAMRRNDPSFLANKIYEKLSKEGNPQADAVRSKLMNRENWYLPFKWDVGE